MIRSTFFALLALGVMTPSAMAACDISNTDCAKNGGKCNIKFKNQTGLSSGSSKSTSLSQESSAHTIRVKALKDDGKSAGNSLTINAGASNTMNMDKKANKNFAKIRISSEGMSGVQSVSMGCGDVRTILNGSGVCKVFYGSTRDSGGGRLDQLGYDCAGGSAVKPK